MQENPALKRTWTRASCGQHSATRAFSRWRSAVTYEDYQQAKKALAEKKAAG
ncbi:hypothetical protein OG599_34560 (plasmid) [Streptomyces sp. NBC_01335]|uniref:hypothetical protein n=1 Tax=Streptomyces sp. NBC_01335 TaxID=2903828 RepID=UPI002E102BF3|nr:hypothetical protein OG599_34560 [Streptomyces sp. NBC_01335]